MYRIASKRKHRISDPLETAENFDKLAAYGGVIKREKPGAGYFHVLTNTQIMEIVAKLPIKCTTRLKKVLLPTMTARRKRLKLYGLQYDGFVVLYPEAIENSQVMRLSRSLSEAEAKQYKRCGGIVAKRRNGTEIVWPDAVSLQAFYVDVLLHEIAHTTDNRMGMALLETYADSFVERYRKLVSFRTNKW